MGWIISLFILYFLRNTIKNKFIGFFKSGFKTTISILIIVVGIYIGGFLLIKSYKIIIFISIILIAYGYISHKLDIKRWLKKPTPNYNKEQIEDFIISLVHRIEDDDTNSKDYKFDYYNIPYGRANTFLNYFAKNIGTDEIYYYSPICSSDSNELREYGTMITNNGIYISYELKNIKLENGEKSTEIHIPFSGLYSNTKSGNKIRIENINSDRNTIASNNIDKSRTTIDIIKFDRILNSIIKSDIPKMLYKQEIQKSAKLEESRNKTVIDAEERFNKSNNFEYNQDAAFMGGFVGANTSYSNEYNEYKNYMNGSRGSGYAAEYANNTFDKVRMKNVKNAGQNLDENNRQVKNGADRIVNNQQVQTKYYKNASESIGAVFQHKKAIYLDQNGNMMQIEVPRDQYAESLNLMQKRIDSGQVPNVEPGTDARKYVRKGSFTWLQSQNLCKSGSIESLTVDVLNGAICVGVAASISGVIVFSIAVWNGEDIKEAAKASMYTSLQVIGKGTLVYTLTMQLSRSEIINPFIREYTKDGITKGFAGINNPIFIVCENIASSINKSSLSKLKGFKSASAKSVISSGIIVAITFGPDICNGLRGRISTKQLFKNSAVSILGFGGYGIGQILIPIPIVGGMAGAMVSQFIVKNNLDKFIEDDAKLMFQILKEEFLDVVMLSNLTEYEFNEVVELTLRNKKLSKILREMYASNEYRKFAREALVSVAVINILSKREKIMEEDILEGYSIMIKEISIA